MYLNLLYLLAIVNWIIIWVDENKDKSLIYNGKTC